MQGSKIKNVFILTLLLVNVFLLFLVVPQQTAASREQESVGKRLTALYADKQIKLDWSIIGAEQELYELELDTSSDVEIRAADILLGSSFPDDGDTDVIKRTYKGQNGTADFKNNGEFVFLLEEEKPVSDYETDLKNILSSIGFEVYGGFTKETTDTGHTVYKAIQSIQGAPVYTSNIEFCVNDKGIHQITGKWYTLHTIASDAKKTVSAKTALISFLGSQDNLGWVCSEILSVQQGYEEETSPIYGVTRLIPIFKIKTDTGEYHVDGITCAVSSIG